MLFQKSIPFEDVFAQAGMQLAGLKAETAKLDDRLRTLVERPLDQPVSPFADIQHRLQLLSAACEEQRKPFGTMVFLLDQRSDTIAGELDAVRVPTRMERVIGVFSKRGRWRRQRVRQRIRPAIERLAELVTMTDSVAGLVKEYQQVSLGARDAAETHAVKLAERRREILSQAEAAADSARKLSARAMTTAGRIGLYGDADEQERMKQDRLRFLSEAEAATQQAETFNAAAEASNELAITVESLVELLNRHVVTANALLRKLMVDAEERLVLYRSQVESEGLPSSARLDPEKFLHIHGPLRLWTRGILSSHELLRRKTLADAGFFKAFPEHAPNEQSAGAPLINTVGQRLPSLKMRFRLR